MSPEPQVCKYCGTENPADVLFCLICGKDLAGAPLTDIPEGDDNLDESSEHLEKNNDLPDFIRNLHDEIPRTSIRRSSIFEEPVNDEDVQSGENPQNEETADQNIPEWLRKIRERALTEDDAAGDLIKKVAARDIQENQNSDTNPNEEFEGWLGQVRKSAQRDTDNIQQEDQDDLADDEEIPAWLIKVRESEGKLKQENLPGGEQSSLDPHADPGWVREGARRENEINLSTEPTQAVRVKAPGEGGQSASSEQNTQSDESENGPTSSELASAQLSDVTQQLNISPSIEFGKLESKEKEENIKNFWEEIAKNPVSAKIKEQHSKAELFKALISIEGQPTGKNQIIKNKNFRAIRIILALLLIILVTIPFFFEISNNNYLGSLPAPAQEFFDGVNSLETHSKVLLVVDYSAGVSAEMEQVSAPIIAHLVESQAELSLISSYPEGAWLGERLITFAIEHNTNEISRTQVTNLGYLPGGRIGLYNLAHGSYSSIFDGLIDLETITKSVDLEEFDQIIILVDTLQSARNWIELVSTRIPNIPINMVSSLQEAAMLLPYYDSGQIKGLVAGLYDSNLYQTTISDNSSTGASWLSYQVGLLFMIGLMLLGIIIRLESSGDRIYKEIKNESK